MDFIKAIFITRPWSNPDGTLQVLPLSGWGWSLWVVLSLAAHMALLCSVTFRSLLLFGWPCGGCPLLESQEILASLPLRTVLRVQGPRDPWHSAEHNLCREDREDWKSWPLPYLIQGKRREPEQRGLLVQLKTMGNGLMSALGPAPMYPPNWGAELLLNLTFSHRVDFQW